MRKTISILIFAALAVLLVTFASAQEKKPVEPPKPAMNSYQELMIW